MLLKEVNQDQVKMFSKRLCVSPQLRFAMLSCIVLGCCAVFIATYFSVYTLSTISHYYIQFNSNRYHLIVYGVSIPHVLPNSTTRATQLGESQDFAVNRASKPTHKVTNRTMFGGFILAMSYYDQLTSATRRLFHMHHWAAALNLTVVEPFILRSRLGLNEVAMKWSAADRDTGSRRIAWFGDMFSIEDWNRFIASVQVDSRMVTCEEFLHCAPRNIIYIKADYSESDSSFTNTLLKVWSCPTAKFDLTFLSVHGFIVSNAFCVTL